MNHSPIPNDESCGGMNTLSERVLYPQRTLRLSAAETPPELARDPVCWAVVAIANMRRGDEIAIDGQVFRVRGTGFNQMVFANDAGEFHLVPSTELWSATLESFARRIADALEDGVAPGESSSEPLLRYLARDPAFRMGEDGTWGLYDLLLGEGL